MSYTVYRVASVGMPRDHHAIFVEVNDDQSGHLFQVVGNIQNGMTHGHRPAEKPEEWIDYQGKIYIGRVSTANYSRIQPICDAILPPKKQFEGPRRLYPAEPIRRCQEWTQEAIDALVTAGILEQ
ncbi:hypothetical protein BJX68DRAFT_260435 [Aspergillus pseudodeflectus]|uniref:Uncharacterized protein n=1 Tax=Aspergillus pseudodeflectus TaxID=176178 RepID=A0ABR4LAR0_9EURO